MKRTYTQKEIYDFLLANPLNVKVNLGDLEDMRGQDYIFLDYLNDVSIRFDNNAKYQTIMQITIFTKDFEDRQTLVNYIKTQFLSSPTYSKSDSFEYYQAQFNIGVFLTWGSLQV